MSLPAIIDASTRDANQDGSAVDLLYRSERRLHGILDTAHEPFIAFDAEGLILDWNAAAARVFGWGYVDALGRKLTDLFDLPEPLTPGRDVMALLVGEGVPDPAQAAPAPGFRLQARGNDGRRFPVQMALSRQPAGDSHVWHAFLHDLTEQERADRDRREAEERLSYQALHDDLTGLANRALLMDRLEHALERARRHDATVAVLFVDLDRFKLVNETIGHWAGDALLIEVAERLRHADGAASAVETVARVGADEFVLVCEDVSSESDAAAIAQQLVQALQAPMLVGDERLHTSASIGVALAAGVSTAQSLLRDADAAAARAQQRGGARCELFDPDMRARLLDRQRRERELRQAIEGDQLRLFYQPIVSAFGGEVVAAEALVRWQHPERGLLGPHEFLPLAEEVGLINALGDWVLETACAQATRWRSLCAQRAPLRVSVNVSGHQLTRENSRTLLERVLAHGAFDPSLLMLEITETVLLQDCDAPAEALAALRDLGVQIMLDDFGTGYSSLSYLHRLPLDGIKLDRSFIAALTEAPVHREITRSVIAMADALNLKVVAEGVETPEQLGCLRRLGCPLLQGYYFAKPLEVGRMTALLEVPGERLSPAVQL